MGHELKSYEHISSAMHPIAEVRTPFSHFAFGVRTRRERHSSLSQLLCRFSDAGMTIHHARWCPASEKRQGTKSRDVGQRRCGGRAMGISPRGLAFGA
jgi:hypothetical protein